MYGLPFILFFLNDRDARTYFLIGDLIAEGKMIAEMETKNPKEHKIGFDEEVSREIAGRMFNTCVFFLIYCHNTGFDPKPYVEGILADFNIELTYDQVYESYMEKINGGFHFRALAQK
jgi:hypothetical protein